MQNNQRTDIWTHWVSRFMQFVAETPIPRAARAPIFKSFGDAYGVDWAEVPEELSSYETFEDFFTRQLPEDSRPIQGPPDTITSPCDGAVHSVQPLATDSLIQAKGKYYSLQSFLGPYADEAIRYMGGTAVTLYLRPKDYHHVHAPFDGEITQGMVVPGSLWPVNPWANRNVNGLYARNERVGMALATKHAADAPPVWYFMVGALCVGGIETRFCFRPKNAWHGPIRDVLFSKGDELGQFLFGSTVIMLFPAEVKATFSIEEGQEVRLGQPIGAFQ